MNDQTRDNLKKMLREGDSQPLPPAIAKPLMDALTLLDSLPNLRLKTAKQRLFVGLAQDINNGEDTSEITFLLKSPGNGQIDVTFSQTVKDRSISLDSTPIGVVDFNRLVEGLNGLNAYYASIEEKLREAGFLGA